MLVLVPISMCVVFEHICLDMHPICWFLCPYVSLTPPAHIGVHYLPNLCESFVF